MRPARAEIFSRAEYYRQLLHRRDNIAVHRTDLDTLSTAEGAKAFLENLALAPEASAVQLPAKANSSKSWPLGKAMKAEVVKLVDAFPFDPADLAKTFLDSGRRLA